MQVEDADFARVDDTPDGFETRAVVRPLVLAVLDELAGHNVRFELGPADEVIVLAINFSILFWPACVCWKILNEYVVFYLRADVHLRGMAAANLSESSINLCLSSWRPIFGGPIKTIGRLWFALG